MSNDAEAFSELPPPGFDPAEVAPPPLGEGPWRIHSLALDVAGRCNLACRYCAEAATQPRRPPMTLETLEAAWRLLFPDGRPHPGTSLRLGSGEPLLNLPLLHRLAELITTRGAPDAPAVFLTTNGTLLDETTAAWLAETGWHIKLSLDGPAAIHDRWRVQPDGRGSYTQVAKALRLLVGRIPERLSVTAVLCRGADPAEVFAGIAALGVQRIELVPVAHHDPAVGPGREDIARYIAFVEDYARRYLAGGALPTLVRWAGRVARVMGYDNSRVSCGAGRVFLGVGPEGALYPCFRFIGVERYRLGHLATGPEARAVAAFAAGAGRPYEQREPCRACWAAPLCGGPCMACAELFGGGAPLPLHCAYVRAEARAAVWLVTQLQARDPARLLPFLPGARAFYED